MPVNTSLEIGDLGLLETIHPELDWPVVVQSLSCVQLFVTPWTRACQALLPFTTSWRLLRFMSILLVLLCNHLILCCPLLTLPSIFPSIRVFSNESALHYVAKVVELQLQNKSFQWIFRVDFLSDWLVWSPCSARDSQEVFSSTTIQKNQFFGTRPSL